MTKREQKQFSRRFSYADWLTLCGNVDFLEALEESESEAEVVAHRILSEAG